MGSNRLPGKVLMKIHSRSLLEHIFFRLEHLEHQCGIIVATSIAPGDNMIESFCKDTMINYFRGSENDVLERYFLCAKQHRFTHIVRLTGDNPFVDIRELDNLIELHLASKADYSHSFDVLPVGSGAEIFTFPALKRSFHEGTKDNHREHVNEYIQENPELFNISVLSVTENVKRPDIRLTVDTEEDYRRACFIAERSGQDFVTTEKAIELCMQFA